MMQHEAHSAHCLLCITIETIVSTYMGICLF